MGYEYKNLKQDIFTESGMELFIAIRDNVKHLLKQAGAVRLQEAIKDETGEVWLMIACVDRMVELGELREVTDNDTAGQYRVFVEA